MSWKLIAVSLLVLNEGSLTPDSPVNVVPVPQTLGVYQDKSICEGMKKLARQQKEKHVKVACVEVR